VSRKTDDFLASGESAQENDELAPTERNAMSVIDLESAAREVVRLLDGVTEDRPDARSPGGG
jgi:hypothetical protein